MILKWVIKINQFNLWNNSCENVFDPFLGGAEKVASMTSRVLNKSKNISNIEFSSVISRDPFQYRKNSSSSLRSLANIKASMIESGI